MSNAAGDESVERIILAIEQEVFAAIRRKDAAACAHFLGEDFSYRTSDGSELERAAFLQNIANMPVEIVSIKGEHLKVSVYGDVAVLTGVQRAEWRQDASTQGLSSVAFTDVFVRRGDAWLMTLAYGIELPG
jgi:ketosteroid isomerase-like protein